MPRKRKLISEEEETLLKKQKLEKNKLYQRRYRQKLKTNQNYVNINSDNQILNDVHNVSHDHSYPVRSNQMTINNNIFEFNIESQVTEHYLGEMTIKCTLWG